MVILYPYDTKAFLHSQNEKFSEDLEIHQKSYLVPGVLQVTPRVSLNKYVEVRTHPQASPASPDDRPAAR